MLIPYISREWFRVEVILVDPFWRYRLDCSLPACSLRQTLYMYRRSDRGQAPEGIWTTRTQDNSYPGQLVPRTTRTQDNSYPGQLVPKTTRTQDNSYPGQLVPKTTRIQDNSYPCGMISYISYHIISYRISYHIIYHIIYLSYMSWVLH